MAKVCFIPQKLKPWIEARKNPTLSHAQVQIAREHGLSHKKNGGLVNYKQEPWKFSLPEYSHNIARV